MTLLVSHDEIITQLRKIAKKDYWQSIYAQSKEVYGLKLFYNVDNFTALQICFLGNLSFYSSLHYDIAMGDVSELVLKDEVYEDAYAYYRNQKRLGKVKSVKKETNIASMDNKSNKEEIVGQNSWVFTKTKGKK